MLATRVETGIDALGYQLELATCLSSVCPLPMTRIHGCGKREEEKGFATHRSFIPSVSVCLSVASGHWRETASELANDLLCLDRPSNFGRAYQSVSHPNASARPAAPLSAVAAVITPPLHLARTAARSIPGRLN
ncbi:hypothetical protein G6O67_006757 [Ophiocordyceps sinensis]|uniref:Uncharacterized protein n=1 Tax=Ophiocordyceps sinensis TaxID=72228 RepID=A0A8H4LXD6_9HYPO|nr:hypothetical protein G6O67_006757 [Ophiocordyceps sinensis]